MHDFQKPVALLMGLGFPDSVRSVERAHAVLSDWPLSQRGRDHRAAMGACRAVLEGKADAASARVAFILFARQAGVLTDDRLSLMATASTTKAGKHGAPR